MPVTASLRPWKCRVNPRHATREGQRTKLDRVGKEASPTTVVRASGQGAAATAHALARRSAVSLRKRAGVARRSRDRTAAVPHFSTTGATGPCQTGCLSAPNDRATSDHRPDQAPPDLKPWTGRTAAGHPPIRASQEDAKAWPRSSKERSRTGACSAGAGHATLFGTVLARARGDSPARTL